MMTSMMLRGPPALLRGGRHQQRSTRLLCAALPAVPRVQAKASDVLRRIAEHEDAAGEE